MCEEIQRLRQLEEKNRMQKQLVTDLIFDKVRLQKKLTNSSQACVQTNPGEAPHGHLHRE